MIPFCLITFRPNIIWCEFLNLFKNYNIFVIVDDNNYDLSIFINTYNNITFIKIEDEKCNCYGYIDTNFCVNKLISGWDKALFYFGVENTDFDFVWFMEDDVFFYNEDTIINIDNQFTSDDLLSNCYGENTCGDKSFWHWDRINIEYPPPYYNGMMCSVRFSKKMMNCINDYAIQNKTLFFLEALFPTIATKNNLKCSNPEEFNNIHWKHEFQRENINMNGLYHPIKDLNSHIFFRSTL
jgi:hypothetical protein